ncbi:hypothetical protein FS837_004234 [Tulasnella sp. UAMH 9824]|nr:hypothetical protein FS837_004234 [Tulasnella sp. UAMH 9824]
MPAKRKAGTSSKAKGKRKADEVEQEAVEVPQEAKAPSPVPEPTPIPVETGPSPQDRIPTPPPRESPSSDAASGGMDVDTAPDTGGSATPAEAAGPSMTMEDRQAKMQQLRAKMRSTLQANRKDLVEESAKAKVTARDVARQEKQRKLAETLRQRLDAEERGEDVDRKKNWEYTIEENDEWEKRQARKKRRSNFEFNDYEDAARRRYKKDVDLLKPDLEAYQKQKEAAAGSSSQALAAHQDLYRDANSLVYADHKPTEDAIDRVASKLNADIDRRRNFSKTRVNEKEGDVTYINEANRVFNKKIERYYNKYTAEIRANFERGTAL